MYENYYYPQVWATYVVNQVSFNNIANCIKQLNAWHQNQLLKELLDPRIINSSIQLEDHSSIQQIKIRQYKNKLNPTQRKALNLALKNRITVIQGPPGTGKTELIAEIVAHLRHMLRLSQHIMVCAPSNVATDGLSLKISQRVGHQNVLRCTGEFRTQNYYYQGIRELQLITFKGKFKRRKDRNKKYDSFFQKQAIENCDIICSTLQSSVNDRLKDFQFPFVVVDQSTQCSQPECLLPLFKGAKRIILVGDHKQLGPVVTSNQSISQGYGTSLFQRLIKCPQLKKFCSIMLDIQYRMDPRISKYSNRLFYEKQISDGTVINKSIKKAVQFINVPHGREMKQKKELSYHNKEEAIVVMDVISQMLKSRQFEPQQIGVITPYIGQKQFLLTLKGQRRLFDGVQINSVDSYQGREKQVIIITTVRTGYGIGFVGDHRRVNVAITRPKKKLVLVGKKETLVKDKIWKQILGWHEMAVQ